MLTKIIPVEARTLEALAENIEKVLKSSTTEYREIKFSSTTVNCAGSTTTMHFALIIYSY